MRTSVLVLLLGLALMVSVSNGYVQERKDDPPIALTEARADAIRDFEGGWWSSRHTRTPATRGASAAQAVYDSSFWDTLCPNVELHGRKLSLPSDERTGQGVRGHPTQGSSGGGGADGGDGGGDGDGDDGGR
ncbi:hypothetical protein LSAT2_001335 [Lamellibrachia satsuma]|nr:hypothetical protein LSAT2_001335 [Lamellibrachia satsuma]